MDGADRRTPAAPALLLLARAPRAGADGQPENDTDRDSAGAGVVHRSAYKPHGPHPQGRTAMNASAWVDPRISSVRVGDVVSYLTSRGWKPRPYPLPELLVFEGPLSDDGEPIVQVLPSKESMLDFRMRVEELIAALSVLEDRPAADV